jgi:lycopene cyclase domain-containing protein
LGVAHFHYAVVLLFVAVCAIGVNLGFGLRITHLWRAFIATDLVILVIYTGWDLWAVENHNWSFDRAQIMGLRLIAGLPIEEILFFIIVPLMTVLTYLALSKLMKSNRAVGADNQ